MSISNSHFIFKAASKGGGAIYASGFNEINMTSCTMTNNIANGEATGDDLMLLNSQSFFRLINS